MSAAACSGRPQLTHFLTPRAAPSLQAITSLAPIRRNLIFRAPAAHGNYR